MSKYETPPGWSLPVDLADRLGEVMNQKPKSPENELADALEDMARDIAVVEPEPMDWVGWISCFLDQLEQESEKRIRGFDFNSVRDALVNELQDRMNTKMS